MTNLAVTNFFILNGVRRAVVSLRAGRRTVPAVLYREGFPSIFYPRMQLYRLFSGKESVRRDLRFLRIEPPINDPIEIQILGTRGQPDSIPLDQVRLT